MIASKSKAFVFVNLSIASKSKSLDLVNLSIASKFVVNKFIRAIIALSL
jgi:hypothetical protein